MTMPLWYPLAVAALGAALLFLATCLIGRDQ